jgi:hypothetical protein
MDGSGYYQVGLGGYAPTAEERLAQKERYAAASSQNWLTDPNAPWNTWAQGLEGYLQQWVSAQQKGLQADLNQQNIQAGRTAIGQGLYQGTYTTSLPAEQLARMVGQNTQNYAGAMSNLQATGLEQLMAGKQAYGTQMLNATMEDLMRQAYAKAQEYGLGDFFGDIFGPIGTVLGAHFGKS